MKLRPARFTDAPELAKILAERQKDSRYAGVVEVDQPYARKLIASAIGRHGGTNEGSTFVMVAVDADDQPQAFILGALSRVYQVGNRLAACDQYLVGRSSVSAFVLDQLLDAYIAWAADIPKVYEIGASFANTIPQAERFRAAFERRGFTKVGEVYSQIQSEESTMGSIAA